LTLTDFSKAYIPLYKQIIVANYAADTSSSSSSSSSSLPLDYRQRAAKIEHRLSFEQIVLFREMAQREYEREMQKKRAVEEKAKLVSSSSFQSQIS
jgi:hypothetical protein